jgi:hypothetical protein
VGRRRWGPKRSPSTRLYGFSRLQIDVFASVHPVLVFVSNADQEDMLTITIDRPKPRVNVVRSVIGLGMVALIAVIAIVLSRGETVSGIEAPQVPSGRPQVLDSGHHLAPTPVTDTTELVVDPSTMTIYRS